MLQNPTINQKPTRPVVTATKPVSTRREPTQEEIRLRAYQIFESRNREPGHEAEDWAQAERELRGQR